MFSIDASSYLGMASYGKLYINEKNIEYYNNNNINDYIIIPWEEVDYIAASVLFKGKWISRFAIFTKKNGHFSFSTKDNRKTLKEISIYFPKDRMFKSKSFIDVIKQAINKIIKKRK